MQLICDSTNIDTYTQLLTFGRDFLCTQGEIAIGKAPLVAWATLLEYILHV